MGYVDAIITKFGGMRRMARKCGEAPSTVFGWRERNSIPDKKKASVQAAAAAEGIVLTPEDFMPAITQQKERGAA